MPKNLGAAIQNWDLTQYPGIGGALTTTPIPLDSQVAALINGGSLSSGDKLMRVSDFTTNTPAAAVAAVRNSGLLNEHDFVPIVAIAPFLYESGKVYIKQGLVFVSLCFSLPALAAPPFLSNGVNIAMGLPLNPMDTGGQNNGALIAMPRFGRATYAGQPYRGSSVSIEAPSGAQQGGVMRLGGEAAILGNSQAGYTEFITISGCYPLDLIDSVI
jgi:hypothetical protein